MTFKTSQTKKVTSPPGSTWDCFSFHYHRMGFKKLPLAFGFHATVLLLLRECHKK